MARSVDFPSRVPLLAAALALCLLGPIAARAQSSAPAAAETNRLVITGARPATDTELTRRVEAALDAHPYLDASRITVSTRDGVVHLEGLVADGDLLTALRISGRIAGTRRVVDELETYSADGAY